MTTPLTTVTLSLVSHTNVGKTTLARTLLRRDIGEVRDQPHVTDLSEAFTIVATSDAVLRLWDTPGFGDTARLLRRLRGSGNPIGWLLSQVWDRFVERPLWCSQQAVRNVRTEADIVLYLINAAEGPAQAAYVEMEMDILQWAGVPVIALLNQTGPPRPAAEEEAEARQWGQHLERFSIVKRTLNLDAFARCWVQEGLLLDAIFPLLAPSKQPAFSQLADAWNQENLRIFNQSMASLAKQLAQAWCDRETLERASLSEKIRRFIFVGQSSSVLSGQETAMAILAERLDQNIRASLDDLIKLHGLEGQASAQILKRLQKDFASTKPLSEGISALLGGLVSGALGGLVTDLVAGGLTFGGGALVGGILGAASAGGLVKGYNIIRGEATPSVRWSAEFCRGLMRSALLRYLAVAHYGRGRGSYSEREYPKFWQQEVALLVESQRAELDALWEQVGADPAPLYPAFQSLLTSGMRQLLGKFYPTARSF